MEKDYEKQRLGAIDVLIEMNKMQIDSATINIKELEIEKRELEGVVDNE